MYSIAQPETKSVYFGNVFFQFFYNGNFFSDQYRCLHRGIQSCNCRAPDEALLGEAEFGNLASAEQRFQCHSLRHHNAEDHHSLCHYKVEEQRWDIDHSRRDIGILDFLHNPARQELHNKAVVRTHKLSDTVGQRHHMFPHSFL